MWLGKLAKSREYLERGVALLGYPVPATLGRLLVALVGQLLQQVFHRLRSAGFTASEPAAHTSRLEAVPAYYELTEIYYLANETVPTLYAAMRTLNLAEHAEPSPKLALAYANMCIVAGLVPLRAIAEMYSRLALDTVRRLNDLSTLGWVLERTALYSVTVGQWEKAHDNLEQAIEIADRLGDQFLREESMGILGDLLYFRAEFASSESIFAELCATTRRSGNSGYEAWGLYGQSQSLLPRGRTEAAVTLLEAAIPLLVRVGARTSDISCYGSLAIGRLRQGELLLARQAAESVARWTAQSHPTGFDTFAGYSAVAEVFLALWESIDFHKLNCKIDTVLWQRTPLVWREICAII